MKKILILLVIFLMCLSPAILIADEECKDCNSLMVQNAKLCLQGNFQSTIMFNGRGDTDGQNVDFVMGRSRLILKGEVLPNKFYFFTQFEMNSVNPIRDFHFIYKGIPYNTSVAFGRMKPNFTYYFPRSTAKLDLIHYPLMVQHFGMDWQMGVQTTTKWNMFKMNIGVFNGQDIPDNFADNNNYKDYFFRLDADPEIGCGKGKAGVYYWNGTANNDFFGAPVLGKIALSRLGVLAGYEFGSAHVRGEYLTSTQDVAAVNIPTFGKELNRNSYYVQAGYKFLEDKFEALVRYEMYDQNADENNTEQTWTTLGINYYLNSYKTMLYLNYIIMDNGSAYLPESTSYMDGTNDVLILQAQIAF